MKTRPKSRPKRPTRKKKSRPLPKRGSRRPVLRPAKTRAPHAPPPAPAPVIGLTGPNASGKGEVASYLASRGFKVLSLSDVVRERATREGLAHTRDNLIQIGVRMRAEQGSGALARTVLPNLRGPSVVDSIRNPGEVAVLRSLPCFLLVGVDAPLSLRFERSRRRGRVGDGATLEEFERKEAVENSSTEAGQQLRATFALSDLVIDNDGTLEELRESVRQALAERGLGPGAGRDQ